MEGRAPSSQVIFKLTLSISMLIEESQRPGVGPEFGMFVRQKGATVAGTWYAKGKGLDPKCSSVMGGWGC